MSNPSRPWLRLLAVGLVGGVLSGAFGVGGGIVMVPMLTALVGMDQRRASATSLAAILPTSLVASITYLVSGQVDVLVAVLVAAGAIVGAFLGSALLKRVNLIVLQWAFIVLIVAVAIRMLVAAPPGRGDVASVDLLSGAALVGLGLVMGVASGLFGIGGGVIAVPAFVAGFGMGDLIAKGTSLLVMIPTALSGTVANSRRSLVDVPSGLAVGVAASIASFGGVALSFLMAPRVSTTLFAVLLLFTAVQQVVRTIRAMRRNREKA